MEEGHFLVCTAKKRMVSLLNDFSQSTQTIENNNDTITSNHKHSIVGVGIGVGVGLHCNLSAMANLEEVLDAAWREKLLQPLLSSRSAFHHSGPGTRIAPVDRM